MLPRVDGAGLVWGDVVAPAASVLGFHESYDPWASRVVLHVVGPDWAVPVDDAVRDAYGPVRAALRAAFPDRPFTSDWGETGRMPGLVLGGAPAPWFAALCLLVAAGSAGVAATLGPGAGLLFALGWWWPLGRLRPGAEIDGVGLRFGAAWVPRASWHEVVDVSVEPAGRRGVRLRARTADGLQEVVVPSVLLPALRARLWRLGGLRLRTDVPALDLAYARWRAAARGVPWGLLAAACLAVPFSPAPFRVLALGALASAAAGFVGAAVEARVSGWRNGGIVWMTLAWATCLLTLFLFSV